MSGALVELVAKGVQDAYLTGKPEVSFFHQAYKRHTNFAQKPVMLNYTGTAGPNQQLSLKIINKGDLVGYVWMDMNPGNIGYTSSNVSTLVGNGFNAATYFELYVGGQLVDRQDAIYSVQMWQKFLVDSGSKGYSLLSSSQDNGSPMQNVLNSTWLPLHFFFCDSCYLPLVALQYHEVEIRINFGADYVAAATPPNFYVNYVVLDTDERTVIANKEQDLLIEQVQRISAISNNKFDLSFLNHPVKCLLWGDSNVQNTFQTQGVQLYLNGTEVFTSDMPDVFFSSVSSYYHSEFPSILQGGQNAAGDQQAGGNLKMYSFALKANKHQPCGTCNFSRLDTSSLNFGTVSEVPQNFYLYAVNFNIFRIKGGMGGLAFSN